MDLSNQVRDLAKRNYVRPAVAAGRGRFSVAVRDVMRDLVKSGFPPSNWPQVCTALRKKTFLREEGIEIEAIDGPPSKMSTTVVYHYRVAKPEELPSQAPMDPNEVPGGAGETAEEKAFRLTEGLRGLLKEEMAAHGGAEGFLRWVRGYDEEDAA
jgi:hypothetical protein